NPRAGKNGFQARETGDSGRSAARFTGLRAFSMRSWGLRPTLYAVACFAGCKDPNFKKTLNLMPLA
ncbi:MAG: hypothetical protein ACKVX9_16455, partial [Blastocatellia bacterium]